MKLLPLAVICVALIAGCNFQDSKLTGHIDAQPCENIGSQTIASPSGEYRAIIFSRNCGDGTSVNTHVSIVRSNEALPDENGNALVTKHKALPVALRWTDDSELQVFGVSVDSPEKQNSQVSGVRITYSKSNTNS